LVPLVAPPATAQAAALLIGSGTVGLASSALTAAGGGYPVALGVYIAAIGNSGLPSSIAGAKLALTTIAGVIALVTYGAVGTAALPGNAFPASPTEVVSASPIAMAGLPPVGTNRARPAHQGRDQVESDSSSVSPQLPGKGASSAAKTTPTPLARPSATP